MTTTKQQLEQALTKRITEAAAELEALEAVTINTKHKTLTARAVTFGEHGGRIGDYLGIGKALYIYYRSEPGGWQNTDITAYTYHNPDGSEIGVDGCIRRSRTMTPAELRTALDKVINNRRASLAAYKLDLVNAGKLAKQWDAIDAKRRDLLDGVTWASRAALRGER